MAKKNFAGLKALHLSMIKLVGIIQNKWIQINIFFKKVRMAINFILCLPIFWACMDSKTIIWPNGYCKHCILYQKRQIGKAEFPNRSSKLFLFLLYIIKTSLSIWPYNFSPINASSNYVCCVTSLHVYVVLCIQQNRVCSCLFHTSLFLFPCLCLILRYFSLF